MLQMCAKKIEVFTLAGDHRALLRDNSSGVASIFQSHVLKK